MRSALLGLLAGLIVFAADAAADGPSSYKILKLEGHSVRWHRTSRSQTQPIVTYALIGGPTDFPGARNCRRMTDLDRLTANSSVELQAVRAEITAAFAMWQEVAGIEFREAADPAKADIVIGAQLEPEGWAFADVFYDVRSTEAVKPISRSLICLNPAKRWKIGFDGDLKVYDIRYTLAHEIGHAIGLDHPVGAGTIMGYRYEERFRQLQPGDVMGVTSLYGQAKPGTETLAADDRSAPKAAAESVERGHEGLGTRALDARSN